MHDTYVEECGNSGCRKPVRRHSLKIVEVRVAKYLRRAYKSSMVSSLKAFACTTIPVLILLANCTPAVPSQPPALVNFQRITFLAADYRFDGQDQVPAGDTLIRMRNLGREAHHIQLLKLKADHTLAELVETFHGPVTQIPAWAKQVGGPNAVESGKEVEALASLDSGHYAMICVIPAKDGTPHVVLGMYKALKVVGPSSSVSSESDFPSDYHLVMTDYEFTMLEEATAGQHTFRLVNRGDHAHEASLIRLAPHATVEDVLASFAPGATKALPGILVGGVTGLEPGGEGVFTATFSPGRYGLFCLFPNPHYETSHVRRGMAMMFTVE
jgi:hypothetical protein